MNTKPEMSRYNSFLVRLWQEAGVDTPVISHGEVELIQTGQKWEFTNFDRLFEFLQLQILEMPPAQSNNETG